MSLYRRSRAVTWEILSTHAEGDRFADLSALVSMSIFALILLNVIAVILGTVDTIKSQHGTVLRGFEVFSVLVFTVEYALRIWSCVEAEEYEESVAGRLRFGKSFYSVIDLAAIAPFYISFGVDLRSARVLRLLRVFRLIKAARYFSALRMFGEVFRKKKEEIVISLAILGMMTVVTSSLMYYAERAAQPDVFSSIPSAMWWSVVTVTTVGYGNATPVTVPGQMLGGLVALLGTGMGALPAGFLASGFSDAMNGDLEKEGQEEASGKDSSVGDSQRPPSHALEVQFCPHCGLELPRVSNGDRTGEYRQLSSGQAEPQGQEEPAASPEQI